MAEKRTPLNTLRPIDVPTNAKPIKIYGKLMGTIRDYPEFHLLERIRNYSYWKYSADLTKTMRRKVICYLLKINSELKSFANNDYNSDMVVVSDKNESGRKLLIGLKSNTLQSLCLQVSEAVDDYGKIYEYANVYLVERNAMWIMQQMRINNFNICIEQPPKEWDEETQRAREDHKKEMEERKKLK